MTVTLSMPIESSGKRKAVLPPGKPVVASEASPDADRLPACPVCHKRLVILPARSGGDASGAFVLRQLWGCPRGHATTDYVAREFGPIEVLSGP